MLIKITEIHPDDAFYEEDAESNPYIGMVVSLTTSEDSAVVPTGGWSFTKCQRIDTYNQLAFAAVKYEPVYA